MIEYLEPRIFYHIEPYNMLSFYRYVGKPVGPSYFRIYNKEGGYNVDTGLPRWIII